MSGLLHVYNFNPYFSLNRCSKMLLLESNLEERGLAEEVSELLHNLLYVTHTCTCQLSCLGSSVGRASVRSTEFLSTSPITSCTLELLNLESRMSFLRLEMLPLGLVSMQALYFKHQQLCMRLYKLKKVSRSIYKWRSGCQ